MLRPLSGENREGSPALQRVKGILQVVSYGRSPQMAVSQPFLAGMPVNSELDTSILHGIDLCIVGATPTPA